MNGRTHENEPMAPSPRILVERLGSGRLAGGVDVIALALAAGLLVPFTHAPEEWSSLGFVVMVPWLWALDRARSLRQSVALGTGFSLVLATAAFGWFPAVVARYTGYSMWAVWCVWLAAAPLLHAQPIAFAVTRWVVRPRRDGALATMIGWSAPALAWIGIESVIPRLLGDTLGYGLYGASHIRQLADVAGARGLTLLLLVGNVLALAAAAPGNTPRPRTPSPSGASLRSPRLIAALALVALLACSWAYGAWRIRSFPRDGAAGVSVAIVQSNLTDYARLRHDLGTFDAAQLILDTHFALADQVSSADLVVWPETVYPTTFGAPRSADGAELDDRILRFVSRRGVPLVFGTYDRDASGEYNAAALLVPRGAEIERARYHKVHPFPFSEWLPDAIDSPALRERLPWAGRWRPGRGATIWHVRTGAGDLRLAPLICYDAAFTAHTAEAARLGAQLLVSLSNDSWFSDTPAPELHLIVSAFRSVETRLPQIRAANSGVSAVIDAAGEIRARTEFGTRAVLSATVSPSIVPSTLVVRWGDWLGPAALVAAIGLIAAARALTGRGSTLELKADRLMG